MRAIIAATGTGGHINPGIAIANKIKKEQPDSEILFIGSGRGLEKDLVPRAGYKLKNINSYGLSLSNIKYIFKTIHGFKQAKNIIKDFKPDVVIGTGGYICGPVITEAKKLGIPTVLHESNAFPGKAVKMLAKNTDIILVGFEAAIEKIKKAKKIVYTGNPTKIKKINFSEEEKRKIISNLGLTEQKPILLVFGGSQGAKAINDAFLNTIKQKKVKLYQIIWAAGPVQYEIIKKELKENDIDIEKIEGVKIVPYIYNMEEIMNVVDLAMCRSGAITITEIAKLRKPAIFVPLPNVSQNHQEHNARVLEKLGAARIILNKDLEKIDLNEYIEKIILDKDKINEMAKKLEKVSVENVEDKIYEQIINVVKNRN